MTVLIRLVVTHEELAALAQRVGQRSVTRRDVRTWAEGCLDATLQNIAAEHEASHEASVEER